MIIFILICHLCFFKLSDQVVLWTLLLVTHGFPLPPKKGKFIFDLRSSTPPTDAVRQIEPTFIHKPRLFFPSLFVFMQF